MTHIQELAAMAALNKMFKQGHFDVCTLRNVAEMLSVPLGGEAYRILQTLHCIDFASMGEELREAVPELIRECLSLSPTYEFTHLKQRHILVEQSPMKRFLKIAGY